EAGGAADAREHARSDLLIVVESEDLVRPSWPSEYAMGAHSPFDRPADAEKRGQDASGARRRPLGHAAVNSFLRSGTASPCSKRSASTRRARISTRASASSRVSP